MTRIWEYLTTRAATGNGYSMKDSYPSRSAGEMKIHCACCIELDVNITSEEIANTPQEIHHVNDIRYTADGNFQLNQYMKAGKDDDNDPKDLWDGERYFPSSESMRTALGQAAASTEVRS